MNRLTAAFNNIGIRKRLGLSIFFLVFFLVVVVSIILWNGIGSLIIGNMINLQQQSLDKSADFMNYEIMVAVDTSNEIISSDNVKQVVSAGSSLSFNDQYNNYRQIEQLLITKTNTSSVSQIHIYIRPGMFFTEQGVYFANLDEFTKNPAYQKIVEMNGSIFPFIDGTPGAEKTLFFSRAMFNGAQTEVYSIVSVGIPMSTIGQTIGTALTNNSVAILVDRSGNIIASSTGEAKSLPQVLEIQKILGNKENDVTPVDLKGGRYLAGFKKIGYYNWSLLSLTPYVQVRQQLVSIFLPVFLLITAAGTLAYFLAYLSLASIVSRINILKTNMSKVTNSVFEKVEKDGRDEIGELQQSYNIMLDNINDLLLQNYETGMAAKSHELLALQSQINPHFLYNTLDFIKWTARRNDMDGVSDFVVKLSKFYRKSLSKGAETVPLSDEIEHVSLYVDLINSRYKKAVTLILDIDPEILTYSLPRITLQPIVENAVMHGILEKDDRQGSIVISGRASDNSVMLIISDDGVGMPAELVDRLNSITGHSAEMPGYGVKNTVERINLLYRRNCCIWYTSEKSQGTTVTITLPKATIL